MDIKVGDVLVMKKVHPGCGSDRMLVQRCGHVFMIPRSKCEKKIKTVIRETENSEQ